MIHVFGTVNKIIFPRDFTKITYICFRCNTDIEFGVRCGFQTLLVLTGVTSTRDLEKIRKEQIAPLPDVVLPKLGDLLKIVES